MRHLLQIVFTHSARRKPHKTAITQEQESFPVYLSLQPLKAKKSTRLVDFAIFSGI
jgi:hypothetical protein